MPFANHRFRGCCNTTLCCKSQHCKVSVNSYNFVFGKIRTENCSKQSYFCPRAMRILPPSTCPYVVKQPPKNILSPLHQCFCVPLSLSREIFLKVSKNPSSGWFPSQNIRHFIRRQRTRKVNTILSPISFPADQSQLASPPPRTSEDI